MERQGCLERQRGERERERERERENVVYACGIKKMFFLLPSSYSGLSSLGAHYSNHFKNFSFTFFAAMCVFGVLVAKIFSHFSNLIVSALRWQTLELKQVSKRHAQGNIYAHVLAKLACNSCKHMDAFKIKHKFYYKNINN